MFACRDKTGNVSDIGKQISADFIGNFSKFRKIKFSWICARTANDQFGFDDMSNFSDFIIIDATVEFDAVEKT